MMRPKDPRVRDKDYLGWLHRLPCVVCLSHGVMARPVHAAHLRAPSLEHGKRSTGGAEKPSDRWATPLCPPHHNLGSKDSQHDFPGGEIAFWEHHGIDPFELCVDLAAAFDAGRDGTMVIVKHAALGDVERKKR